MKRAFSHIGFSIAITLFLANIIPPQFVLIVLAGLVILFATSLALPKYRQALTVPICIGSAIFACLVFLCVYNSSVVPQKALDKTEAEASFYITDIPQQDGDKFIYTVKTTVINSDGAPQNIKLRLKTDERINADYYQICKANLKLYLLGDSGFNSFGYWGKSVFLTANASDVTPTTTFVRTPMRDIIHRRENIINTLITNVKNDEGALAAALITGNRDALSGEVYNYFKYSGATHLMAVSGFHLTAMSGLLLFILKRLRVNDKVNALAVIGVTVFYCALAGFSKSVVRAGIMLIVLMLGRLFSRRADALNSLGIAAFLICLNPFAVCDIGADLSVLSVLSLVTFRPVLNKVFGINREEQDNKLLLHIPYRILDGFLIAVSVMLYSLPIMYLFFGYVSIAGLVSNIVLVPLGSVGIYLSLLSCVFGASASISSALFFLTKWVNHLIIIIVKFFASFRFSVAPLGVYFGLVIAGVLIILGFCFIINKSMLKLAAGISAVLLIFGFIGSLYSVYNSSNVLFCENGAAVINSKGVTVVYGVDDKSDYYTVKQYLSSNRFDIDYLLISGDDGYYIDLLNDFNCNYVVSPYYDELALDNKNCNNFIMSSNYKAVASDDLSFTYFAGQKNCNLDVTINNERITLDSNENAPIMLYKNTVYDYNGDISLSNGDVIYTIAGESSFTARRFNKWEK